MITLDRLKYFKAVATTEHVGRAAKVCNISPSVISSAISVLEDELSCSLFTKENNRLKLNENGYELLERSKHLLNQIEKIYSEIGQQDLSLKGHYKISGDSILIKDYLLKCLAQIGEEHKELSIEFSIEDTISTLYHLVSSTADFGLVFKSIHMNDIEEHVLYEGQFHICVRKSHPILKIPKTKRLDALNKLPAITFKSPSGSSIYEEHPELVKLGVRSKHKYFYNNNDISIDLLKNTDGWALLPDLVFNKNSKQLSVIKLNKEFNIPMKVCLVKNKRKASFALFNIVKEKLSNSFSS